MDAKYNEQKHDQLLAVGRKLEKGITHKLGKEFVEGILATLQVFGAGPAEMQQFGFDLVVAKYKIWDFLGINYSNEYMQNQECYKGIAMMVDLYIAMEDVGGFAWALRGHDYFAEEPKKCEDCIKSYLDYQEEAAQVAA